MYIEVFVNITSRAWALPILSEMFVGIPGRQAALLNATGASRSAFAQSMEHLIQLKLVERNPGHGHPLRPEFRLTNLGQQAGVLASQINNVTSDNDQDLLRRSWTLPILTSLHRPNHFNQIKRSLFTITDRALSHSLKSMEDRNWVQRRVDEAARPPRPVYQAVNTGAAISHVTAPEIVFPNL